MIVYDGVSLNSVANVKIEDIRVGPIQFDEVTRPRAIQAGSTFIRSRAGTRTVAITFALLEENKINRQASLDAITRWAKNDKEYRLDLTGHPDYYLMAVCTGFPEPSLRQWWEGKLRLVFTCYENPYWNSKNERSVACGTAFNVMGDAPPLMRIERTLGSDASDQLYSLDGVGMAFSLIPAGNMVIDLNRQTAQVGTTSFMAYYNVNSRFIVPRVGSQTIMGTGTVVWRERWR